MAFLSMFFNDTALIDSIGRGNTEVTKLLLEQEGIDVNMIGI